MSFSITKIKDNIGVEINADKETLLSGKHATEIRESLEAHGCFVIREINFTSEEQLAFTKTLGHVIDEGEGGIYKVTLDVNENEHADYLKGSFYWHMDGSTLDVPILASILNGFKPSETGGNTEFCSTYVGYEDLPKEEQEALDNLRVVHSLAAAQFYVHPEPTLEQISTWSMMPSRSHPLVWKHASGRKSLVIGATASHIEGMDFEEGRALLHKLRIHCTQPKYVYSHKWTKGDLVAWDNTGTLHRATAYPLDSGRMMHRTKLEGEESIS